jgi:hypothetical protein
MERVGLFPLHHKLSYACFVWVFGLGLFLFLMVHSLLGHRESEYHPRPARAYNITLLSLLNLFDAPPKSSVAHSGPYLQNILKRERQRAKAG